ncbi:hypothetical protein PENTCL1PPCAC_18949, partial [Pristionchus entomophagus]
DNSHEGLRLNRGGRHPSQPISERLKTREVDRKLCIYFRHRQVLKKSKSAANISPIYCFKRLKRIIGTMRAPMDPARSL